MSGWATVTVQANDEESAQLLRDMLANDCERDDDAWLSDDTTVNALSWGYGSGGVTRTLKDYSNEWSEAIVMECNDTSDSGNGTYYTSDGSSVTEELSASGYEGARGHDAAGRLRDEAGFRPYMR